MKKTKCLIGTAALAFMMAACSQEEVMTPNQGDLSNKDTSYINVKISMGGGMGSRAAGDPFDGFDIGTTDEGAVNSLALVLYDDNDALVGTGSLTSAELSKREEQGSNISDIYSGVVAVNIIPGKAKPTKLIAVVNTSDIPTDPFSSISALKTGEIGDISKGLKMTTSGYYTDSDWMQYTKLEESNLFDSPAEAAAATEGQKVNVYVERLAAKVTVDNKSQNNDADYVFVGSDGHKYKITFEAKKWSPTGVAKEMYLFKRKFDTGLSSWANEAGKFRSYWANGVNYDEDYETLAGSTSLLTYPTAAEIMQNGNDLDGETAEYITEHTYGESAKDEKGIFRHEMTGTNAVVMGQYKIEALDGGDLTKFEGTKDSEFDFYLTLRGFEGGKNTMSIYSRAEVIKILLGRNGIEGVAETPSSSKELSDAEYVKYFALGKSAEDGSYSIDLALDAPTLYKLNSGDEVTDEDLLAGTFNTAHYRNGWAYFFIPIQHNSELAADKVGAYGVVRNHSYKINVNSITGLGVPMDNGKVGEDPEDPDDPTDPEEPIVPDEDDLRNAYISATLNVLSWHNANEQNVDLK